MVDHEDEDRAAILSRRNRLIAVALSGIGATACAQPSPCLSVAPEEPVPEESPQEEPSEEEASDERADEEGQVAPMVCLSVAVPPEEGADRPTPQPPPRPCLAPPRSGT